MKERYNIKITDIQLSILSDEPEDFVRTTVAQLDHMIRDLSVKNKRCSKLDAALLCALDSLSEKSKNEAKIRNLEAQISLYEETTKRLRDEITALRVAAAVPTVKEEIVTAPVEETSEKETPTPEAPVVETAEEAVSAPVEAEATPETKPEVEAPAAVDEPAPLHDAKLRQIEELLRRRSEENAARSDGESNTKRTDAPASSSAAIHDDKLREIEELLRRGGKSLSEAVHDAIGK